MRLADLTKLGDSSIGDKSASIFSPEIEKHFKTNLYGPINLIKTVLPYMRKNNIRKYCG